MVVRRHPERKVVRLADCVSVVKLPPHAEACPGENMAAFCVETEDKRLVFAAEKQSCGEWVDIICNIAFQVKVWIFQIYFYYTVPFKSLGLVKKKEILLFSKDALYKRVNISTGINGVKKASISNTFCSLELSIHQRIMMLES